MPAPERPDTASSCAAVKEEHAALRRVSALVATGASPADVFAAIAREVARVLCSRLVHIWRWEHDGTATIVGGWSELPTPFTAGSNWPLNHPQVAALVDQARGGSPLRIEDLRAIGGSLSATGQGVGIGSAAVTPIVVDGRTWGVIGYGVARGAPLPDRVEGRLAEVTQLVTTAISSSAARERLARLADEQAALRRVAALVTRESPPAEVFDAVAEEVGRLLGVAATGLVRYESDEIATVVAGWSRLGDMIPVGARLPVGGENVSSRIARTGQPARLDDLGIATGPIADHARRLGLAAACGGPIMVAGRLWGAMIVGAVPGRPLPPDTESRLGRFTELIATVVSNTEARVESVRLAAEQAALRRVATMVAEAAPAAKLFANVAEEVASVLGPGVNAAIVRYENDDTAAVLAVWGEQLPGGVHAGARLPAAGGGVIAVAARERGPVRVDYPRQAIGCPVLVQDRLWGAIVVGRREPGSFPADTERRVAQFTDLVATAVANVQARSEVQRLAEEQAALRRVATLVAEAAAPTDVLDASIAEVARLLGAAQVGMMRAESPGEVRIVAHHGQGAGLVHVGMRLPLDGASVTALVLQTGRPARLDHREPPSGTIGRIARRSNANATVGAPITVFGALWGVITASWERSDVPPANAEERLAEFAQLLGIAIANAEGRDQLSASRALALTAGDDARRRLARDLHDGAQQRLVYSIITLKLAQRALGEDTERAASLLADALEHAEQGNAALRELARGILPDVLTRGGLRASVENLVSRFDLPVDVKITSSRLPRELEASAYFIVAEALTNVVKHAHASEAEVSATLSDGVLTVEIRDDGIGGADPRGHGLVGMADRAAALGGRLRIHSPRGGGTLLTAELPLPA